MSTRQIANLALTGQAIGIFANSLPSKKKGKKKSIVKTGVESIVGLALLRESAGYISGL